MMDSKISIAVVGMACRFPGASTPSALYDLGLEGKTVVRDIPEDRWDVDHYYDPDGGPGKMMSRVGGFLDSVDGFDASFFGVSKREAAQMDPQQRLLLEVAWEAFEHAGLPPQAVAGSSTGVFCGVQRNDYGRLMADPESFDAYTVGGNQFSMTVSRLSHFFDLRGPCLSLDAGCSSALVAAHYGCQSLTTGESDLCLVGGVHLTLAPHDSVAASQAWMLSPTGACRSFDAEADGYVRSEGCGLFVLKRLDDAKRDGDAVLAVIRGTAFFQEGRPGGFTSPWGPEIERTFRTALARAGVSPDDVAYVEGHGVGSPVGDAVEYGALARVIGGTDGRSRPCYLGAIKPNIGHSESASGAASMMRAIEVMGRRTAAPLLHFKRFPDDVPEELRSITIPTEPTELEGDAPLHAAVNAFGLGGTNATIVFEGAEAPSDPDRQPNAAAVALVLSARSKAALGEHAMRYREHIAAEAGADPRELAAASARRATLPHRAVVLGTTREELMERLDQLTGHLDEGTPELSWVTDAIFYGQAPARPPRLVFSFREIPAIAGTEPAISSEDQQTSPNLEVPLAVGSARVWLRFGVEPVGVVADEGHREVAEAFRQGWGKASGDSKADGRELPVLPMGEESGALARELSVDLIKKHLTHSTDLVLDVSRGGGLMDLRRDTVIVPEGRGRTRLLNLLAGLFIRGIDIDFTKLETSRPRHLPLPSYPFQRTRAWVDDRGPGTGKPPTFESVKSVDAPGDDVPMEFDAATREGQREILLRLLVAGTAKAIEVDEASLDPERPISELGLSSVDLLSLLEEVRRATGVDIDPAQVMDQPPLDELATRMIFGGGTDLRVVDLDAAGVLDPGIIARDLAPAEHPPKALLLTGATGFVGSFLLRELLDQSDATVYCLVRAIDALDGESRIRKNLESYGLSASDVGDRVVAVCGDLTRDNLGLSYDRFDLLGSRVDAIVHNGALVNWASPYALLEAANVGGTESVIRLGAHLKQKPVHHVSTIGVFPLGDTSLGTLYEGDGLPEPRDSMALGTGYNQSKWVAEKLLYTAGGRRGLPVSIHRPGFVTGRGDTGAVQLGRTDFIASFLKGILAMGQAPDWDVALDLMPVDFFARAMVALSFGGGDDAASVRAFHYVNPRPMKYGQLYEALRGAGYRLETVPYRDFRESVLTIARGSSDHPLFPFWPYFDALTEEKSQALEEHMGGGLPFDDAATRGGLAGMAIECPPVEALLPVYLDYYQRVGFIERP